MAETFPKLYQGQAPLTVGTLATVPAGQNWIIRHIRVVNTHTAAQTIELWDGGTADVNKILGSQSIDPDKTYTEDCFVCLEAGGTIAGKASVASEVTVTLYGVRITT